LFSTKEHFKTKLSLDYLQTDEGRDIIEKVTKKFKTENKVALQFSEAISDNYLQTEEEQEQFINLEEVKRSFTASGNHLYDFIMNYNFPKEVDFSERVTLFCKIVSIYDKEFEITDKFNTKDNIEFAMIYPK